MKKTITTHRPDLTPPPVVATESPNLLTKANRLRRELTTWAKQGFELVPTDIRKERLATCRQCEFFNPGGNFGLGECGAPGCGCTTVKAALGTSKCPHPNGSKWLR